MKILSREALPFSMEPVVSNNGETRYIVNHNGKGIESFTSEKRALEYMDAVTYGYLIAKGEGR